LKSFDVFLNFDGDCRPALDFYAKVFGLDVPSQIMTYEQATGNGAGKENTGRILYSQLPIFGSNIMFSDCPAGKPYVKGTNMELVLNTQDEGEMTDIFNALAQGGKVLMPLAKTFFSDFFGSVTDRFGFTWVLDKATKKAFNVFLSFDGDCRTALEFYAKVFDLAVPDRIMTFDQDPEANGAKENADRIMYAELPVFGAKLMMSDCRAGTPFVKGTNLAITLGTPDTAEIKSIFDALADKGKTAMPLGKTFFSECYGMLTDRFGITWQLSTPPESNPVMPD